MPHFGEMVERGTLEPVTVVAGASPYTHTAAEDGVMYLTGGTLSVVSIVRGGTTVSPGLLAGAFFLRANDRMVITYVVAPTMTWVPQ